MGSVSYYATGEYISNFIWELFKEGKYNSTIEILKEGGFDIEKIRLFFTRAIKLEGDTRGDGIYGVSSKPYSKKKLSKIVESSLDIFVRQKISFSVEDLFRRGSKYDYRDKKFKENVDALFSIFPIEYLRELIFERRLNKKGYKIVDKIEGSFSGVLLSDGTIIKCGYQQHSVLFPFLWSYRKVDNSDWMDCNDAIHISSNQLSGSLSYQINDFNDWRDNRNDRVTDAMIKSLNDNKSELSFYGRGRGISVSLMSFIEGRENMGGKYGKLKFLQKCYPEINLPKFSKEEIYGVKNCIRTSPKLSMAGLLNSKFDINENSIKEIEADFKKYKSVVGRRKFLTDNGPEWRDTNELHYFYQEYLEGINGVAHFRGRGVEAEFTYDCSEDRGAVVDGKKGNAVLTLKQTEDLHNIVKTLNKDIGKDIQVEFVIHNDEVYIVQLRTLEKSNEYRGYTVDEERVIVKGKSFSMRSESDLTPDDVLVIDEDCESEMVIGKKAVIVRNDVEFSHALALSFSLGIPSMYVVGNDFELPEKFSIDTKGREGYILKPI